MPEPKLSRLAATVFCNPDQIPLQPPRRRHKKRPHKRAKRYHRIFRLPIALGLYPTKQRQCDPFGLRLSTMHIMEGECEKSGGILTAEGAPEIGTKANGVVLGEEVLENGDGVLSPQDKGIDEQAPGQDEEAVGREEPGVEEPEPPPEEAECVEESECPEEPACSEEPTLDEPHENPEQLITERLESPEQLELLATSDEQPNSVPEVAETVKESPCVSPTPSPPRVNGLSCTATPAASPKLVSPPKEEKEDSEEEEKSNPVSKLPNTEVQIEKIRKRSLDGEASSSSESDSTKKRLRHQEPSTIPPHPPDHLVHGEDERESSIQKFIEGCAQSIEEINLASEKLQKEMSALAELAKAKEIEWNSILRLRKLKEEMYERLQRKKREVQVLEGKFSDEFYHHNPYINQGVNLAGMMPLSVNPLLARIPDLSKQQRPILPKPFHPAMDHSSSMREGRNGPILDVKSIIADYSARRSRHGGDVLPGRRGRRRALIPNMDHPVGPPPPRHVSSSPSLISMANMALGTAFSVRAYDPPPPPYPPLPMVQERVGGDHGHNPSSTSFKEALVQFAKLGPGGARGGNLPYPEVTLHPVGSSGGVGQPLHAPPTSTSGHSGQVHLSHLQPPHPTNQSLLHGILTKTPAPAHTKPPPTTFSPTLARLLTAPDHPRPQPAHQNSYHRPTPVNINEILASKKSRTDITITPVSSSNSVPSKPKEEVVLLDEDEEGSTGDRLVIDEGPDASNQEDVPQCQGCRQKPAQFVCAGCGNQWYCSRECQVSAWEEHSDVCSG